MLTPQQVDRIADYKRVPAESLTVKYDRMIYAGSQHLGYVKCGLALIDRYKGYAVVAPDGAIQIMGGRYYL